MADVTRLLQDSADNKRPSDELFLLVYDQLRKIAQQRMAGERSDHTVQATALVHEAYLRLIGDKPVEWANRAHFFTAASEAMRRILVEHARAKGRVKRGGPRRKIPLEVVDLAVEADSEEILAVDEAIRRLEQRDPDMGRVVRLRFFAGLSEAEAAEVLGVSGRTVRRDWTLAKAWLRRELSRGDEE